MEAEIFARKVLADQVGGLNGAAFVLDVGKIRGRGWAVVEANSAPSSGLVGCEAREALQVIQKAIYKIGELRYS